MPPPHRPPIINQERNSKKENIHSPWKPGMTHFDSAPEPSLDPRRTSPSETRGRARGASASGCPTFSGRPSWGSVDTLWPLLWGTRGPGGESSDGGPPFLLASAPGLAVRADGPWRPSLQRRLRVRQGPRHCGRRHLQQLTRGAMAAGDVASDPTFFSRKNA